MLKPLIHLQSYNIHIYPHHSDSELNFYGNIYQLNLVCETVSFKAGLEYRIKKSYCQYFKNTLYIS